MIDVHPATIAGTAIDLATRTVTPIVARRTGDVDGDGLEVYAVPIPLPGSWMREGRVALHFDMVPGRSTFLLDFQASS